jgi:predicted alpha/beta superfamily hydrolase
VDWLPYATAYPGRPHTVVGEIQVRRGVDSAELGDRRDLLVYLPPSYGAGGPRTYPTLYFQDGQNLFDRHTSFAGEWRADETLEALAAEGLEAIAVAIPNAGRGRIDEYSPFRHPGVGGGRADAYLRFLLGTVQPLVARRFRTAPEGARTGILGSSMGGLLGLYAFFAHSGRFGLLGALSPSVGFAGGALLAYVERSAAPAGRIYLDVGSEEGPARPLFDRLFRRRSRPYPRRVRELADLLLDKGYVAGSSLLYREEPGGRHEEAAWARRLPDALRFLLGA